MGFHVFKQLMPFIREVDNGRYLRLLGHRRIVQDLVNAD